MTRGVRREHAELLPEDASDPLPTLITEDLADYRRQSLQEELVTMRTKARQAFQGPWLQSTERELHETTVNLLKAGVDSQTRASLEAYKLLLQEKLKQHHQNLGVNLDCPLALEERKRSCVVLGLLSKEHRDLVTTLFQAFPTVEELDQSSLSATPQEEGCAQEDPGEHTGGQNYSPGAAVDDDNEDIFITPLPSWHTCHSAFETTCKASSQARGKRP